MALHRIAALANTSRNAKTNTIGKSHLFIRGTTQDWMTVCSFGGWNKQVNNLDIITVKELTCKNCIAAGKKLGIVRTRTEK